MNVVLLAPARLSARPDLARLAAGTGNAELRRLRALRVPGVETLEEVSSSGDAVVDGHVVSDPSLVPASVWEGQLDVAAAPGLPPGWSLDAGVLRLSPHGIVTAELRLAATDLSALGRVEQALCPWVAALFGAVGAALREHGPTTEAVDGDRGGGRDLRADAFLWWHRVLVGRLSPAELEQYGLTYYSPTDRGGVEVRVGDGYTACASDRCLDDVVAGLRTATQVWLVDDRLARRSTEQAALLRVASGHDDLAEQRAAASDLVDRATLETSVLLEELRYVSGLQRHVVEQACAAWRTPLDLSTLVLSTERLRQSVARRHQEAQEGRATRLNRLLVGLTVVSGLSVVLALFETSVGEAVPGELATARVAVAVATVLAGLAMLVYVSRDGR